MCTWWIAVLSAISLAAVGAYLERVSARTSPCLGGMRWCTHIPGGAWAFTRGVQGSSAGSALGVCDPWGQWRSSHWHMCENVLLQKQWWVALSQYWHNAALWMWVPWKHRQLACHPVQGLLPGHGERHQHVLPWGGWHHSGIVWHLHRSAVWCGEMQCHVLLQVNSLSLHRSSHRVAVFSDMLAMRGSNQVIIPTNFCSWMQFLSWGIAWMASTFSGSGWHQC